MTGRIPGIRRLFRVRGTRAAVEREVEDELRFHLDARTEALIASGLSAADAREQALREFGDVRDAREELVALDRRRARRTRVREWGEAIAFDLRYAVRGLKAQPALTTGIVLTLALGIGANATMFGVVPGPAPRAPAHLVDPDHAVRLYFSSTFPTRGKLTYQSVGYPTVAAMDSVPAFQAVGAWASDKISLGRGSDATPVNVQIVTASFFRAFGVRPALGRFFAPDEGRPSDGPAVVVLDYGFWQRHFAGDPGIIGRTIPLGTTRYTVVGIAPFGLTTLDLTPVDVWLPLSAATREQLNGQWNDQTQSYALHLIARLRAGVSATRAAAEATTAYVNFQREERAKNHFGGPQPMDDRVVLESANGLRNTDGTLTVEARISRWLVGVSLIVLLIACANVANLLLARATRRRREIAVRLALGIGRRRLVAQLMAESTLLALLGGIMGLLIAQWGGAVLRGALLPAVQWSGSPIDMRVLGVTAALVVGVGILVGLAPTVQATGTELTSALKTGARDGVRRARLRSVLIIAQAALSVVLLVGAGLFVRSLDKVQSVDLGMDIDHVLAATIDLQSVGYKRAERTNFFRAVLERVKRLPGVDDAVLAASVPLGMTSAMSMIVPGRPDSIAHSPNGGSPWYNAVGTDFFATMGMHFIRGRGFPDVEGGEASRVAVINETAARSIWPGEDPIGKCMILGSPRVCTTVIGVVKDAHVFRIREDPSIELYVPLTSRGDAPSVLLVRTRGNPAQLEVPVQRILQSQASNLPYADVHPLHDLVDPQIRPWKLGATMFGVFALLALAVASVGLYSVLAYDVAQRVHEMGVRMALGARAPDVVRLIVGDGIRLAAVGIGLGLAATFAGSRAIASLLFDTSPRDATVLAGVSVALLIVAVVASLLPAWRATRVDPSVALRAE